MTREEAIVNLNMISVAFVVPVMKEQRKLIDDTFDMAIEALEQEPKTGQWIPVSERLPEIHNYTQEYIVTIKGNFIRTTFFTETNGKSWWSIDNVIAWMPLPKPYEPQAESEDKE